jgi:glycosyltransferase involved in cell wall biosynthesis
MGMKIAFITTDNRAPSGQYQLPEPFFGTAPEALLQGFARLPEVEVHVISCIRQPVASPAKLAENIFFHSVVVPKNGWMRTLFQGCVRAVRKKLREIRPDIVHGQGTETDCSLDAVFSGFPNVLTLHGNMRSVARINGDPFLSYNWLAARLEGFVLPRTDGVVCITSYTRRAVTPLARRTWILPNAVDAGFFDLQAAPAAGPPVGLCVASICGYKNQNDFIRALDPLAAGTPFKILFAGSVGNDAYGREFLQLVRERPWCEHAGFLSRAQLKEKIKAATFLALPTREDNCPMVVLEAMAAGVPVMASNIGGVPDLIAHEKTGLLCDPTRPETFRASVENLLADAGRRRALAEAARADALARFHPLVVAQRHLEIYGEVLAARHG